MKTWYVVYETNNGIGRITVEAYNEEGAKEKVLEERGWQGIKKILKVEPM